VKGIMVDVHPTRRSSKSAGQAAGLWGPAVLDPQGPIGLAAKTILIDSLAIMLVIVLPTIAAILAFAWWFRASNARAVYLPDWAYSGRIELIVWSIPLMVIMLLGGVAWIGSHDLDPQNLALAGGSPKKRGPDQCAPVMFLAILVSDG
jgi:heme/copper-type cytochrome/quinol oxidase subunit 2